MERIKEIYEMGVELAKKPQYDKARKCFEKCLEIDPNYIPAYYQLLIDAAIREDLKTFLDICKTLKKTGDPKVVKNANYYLLMFQFILGDNYDFHIMLDDILLPPEEEERNKIRRLAFKRDFGKAGDILHCIEKADSFDNDIEFLLESKLIGLARNFYPKRKNVHHKLLAIRDYKTLWEILLDREFRKIATKNDRYLRKLCEAYIEVSKDENYEFQITPRANVYQLIDGKNFRAALSEGSRFNGRFNKTTEDNLLTIALDDICYLKKRMEREKKTNHEYASKGKFNKRVANFHRYLLVQRGAGILAFDPTEEQLEQLRAYNNVQVLPIKDENGNDRYAAIYKDDRYVSNLAQADKYFEEGEYHFAIREYIKVIETTYDYPDYVYCRLADAYEKIGNVKKALIYSRLAFNKINDKDAAKKYEQSARVFKKAKDELNKKARPKKELIKPTEINLSPEDYIKIFIRVNEYICINGVDIETAVNELGLDENTLYIIMLIYARECYKAHMGDKGDKLIKYVEQSPVKTEEVKKLIEQVKAMKKVDMRKPESNEYGIPLTLKISKGGKQKQ